MKIIIAGGRRFNNYNLLLHKCNRFLSEVKTPIEIVSGGARGADHLGERYAEANNYKLKVFPADWDKYGKRAGLLRNTEMANYADGLIAFWDGDSRGTKHMIDIAKLSGLEVRVVRYT